MALRIFIKLGWLYIRSISRWFLGFVLICLSLELAWADPKTEEVIKDIRSKISAITSCRADIVAKEEMMGGTITYDGKWFYKKPNMCRIEINAGRPIVIMVSDGNFLYNYIPEPEIIQKINLKEVGDFSYHIIGLNSFDPSQILGKVIMKAQYVGEEELDGKKMYVLENKIPDFLTAMSKSMSSKDGKLWIGVDDGFLRKMVFPIDEGNKSCEFKNVELNPTFTEDTFHFIPPEGVRIQDATEGVKKYNEERKGDDEDRRK